MFIHESKTPMTKLSSVFSRIVKPVCLAGVCLSTSLPAIAADKMNVVLLLADDLRWNSLGCAGSTILQTPNIDQLAHDGIRFSNSRVTTSICMVSRASILTGQYMSRHGITKFGVSLSQNAFSQSYPAILRNAGYWTGYVGKYGVGNIGKNNFDYNVVYEGKHWLPDGKGDSIHVTAKNERDALYFLRNRPKENPFLLSVGFFATHAEDNHPDQYRYMPKSQKYYQNTVIPVPETAEEKYIKALPPFISSEENEGRRRWHWRFDTPEKYQLMMKAYYRMLTEMDMAIGKIVEELKAQGVYDNTLIIFMGDNGYFQSEHGLADKWYPYEESLRVPLIVHDPRLAAAKKNTTNNEFVLNIDIAPSIIAAAGAQIPSVVQGCDFSPLYLSKTTAEWRQDFYYEHPIVISNERIPASEALVTHYNKYIYWPGYKYEEYFDLQRDSIEAKNSIAAKKDQSTISLLKKRFMELKQKAL